jgi:peptidyl-prolyl cis-trans isomerase B (cyclophilin B)
MLRRLLPALLASSALALAACGDSEETVPEGSSGGTAAETAPETQAETKPTEPASGCRKVDEPKPKDVKLEKPKQRLDAGKKWIALMKTSCGTIDITLDVKDNPKTAASFAHLVREGFYDGLSFHRIVPGFVVQGGDPEGTGTGGPGYSVTEAPSRNEKYGVGTVAMAKAGNEPPGASGSQFFIVTGTEVPLDPLYAVVGRVTKGDKVVELLGNTPNDPAAENRPIEPVIIEKVTLRSE